MRLRQQAPARDRDHRGGAAARAQLERDVEHGQAGADEQDRGVAPDHLERAGQPRIADVGRAGREAAIGQRRVRGRIVPDREHHAVGHHAPGADRHDRAGAVRRRRRAGDLGDDALQRDAGRGRPRGPLEQVLEVLAVELARHERGRDARVLGHGEAQEVVRIVGQGAHAAGRHVEHVLLGASAVGEAASHAAGLVGQEDAQAAAARAAGQEVSGHRRAAEAGAHHDDDPITRGPDHGGRGAGELPVRWSAGRSSGGSMSEWTRWSIAGDGSMPAIVRPPRGRACSAPGISPPGIEW